MAANASGQVAGCTAVAPHVGPVEALAAQAITGETGLVGDPLLVHGLVQARQNAHDLVAAGIDADVAADGVEHIDRLGLLQLPRPRHEGIGLRGQRADRAEIDDVGGELRGESFLDVGADFQMLTAADGAQLFHARHLGREAHAARAVDAAGHHGLDQGAEVLVEHGPLVLVEAAAVEAVGHGLVLQVAFAALVADRAIQRMVDEQEFHHAVARLLHQRRVGLDHHALAHRHGAGGDRLRRLLHLDQAHAAVAGDRQPLVVAEARDFGAGQLAGLQHGHAGGNLELLAIDLELRHRRSPTPPPQPDGRGAR
jgi:hypothetical protein